MVACVAECRCIHAFMACLSCPAQSGEQRKVRSLGRLGEPAGYPHSMWIRGVPLCDSSSGRGGFWLVEGAVAQHGEQHVAASSSESDERLIVALALLDLARVIVP